MNYYGKAIVECLTTPRTLEEMRQLTGFQSRYVIEGLLSARADGYTITVRPGATGEDGVEPSIYTVEDRPHD